MDTKAICLRAMNGAFGIVRKDLNALPEEVFTKQMGGVARTVADIMYEVNLVNDHIGLVIRGEEAFPWPDDGWLRAPENLKTKQAVLDAFEASAAKMLATIESFSREELEAPIETEDGVTNRFERCRFMGVHLWYHSGQLNFIQTMLGDETFHWIA